MTRPFGLQLRVRPNRKAVYLHQALDALLVERKLVYKTQVRPYAPVAPKGVGGLYLADALDKPLVTGGDLLRRPAGRPQSLFFNS